MNIHMISQHEPNGDLINVEYQCSESCMNEKLKEYAPEDIQSNIIQHGAWPGGSETDYNVYCTNCGDFLWHGLINADCQ